MRDCVVRTTCRLCDGPLQLGLSLTPTPPANELLTEEQLALPQDVFPLDVMACDVCAHVQLSTVVSPERLFRQYPYRSGASAQFIRHLKDYADDVFQRFAPRRVIEIGSSDGTFLEFLLARGVTVVGFEPARNIAKIANDKNVTTIPTFFDPKIAGGDADVIVANHVFAHADDLRGIALGVKQLLAPDGVFIFEVGYLLDMVLKAQFDVIYHEHLSFWHLTPMVRFFESLGMMLFDAHRTDTQGGSIRCYVKKGPAKFPSRGSDRMNVLLDEERDKHFVRSNDVRAHLDLLGHRVSILSLALRTIFSSILGGDEHVAAYGAPAKAVTFLHRFSHLIPQVDFIVDDSELKQGKFLPGTGIPILHPKELTARAPDYCLVTGWNFADQIMANNKDYRGKWIVPLPELKII